MASRLPRTLKPDRIHTHMPPAWAKEITRAARLKNMSRSNYIATVAYAAAVKDLGELASK